MGIYLVYKPHPKDRDSSYYYVIDLEKNLTIKIKEIYSYFSSNILNILINFNIIVNDIAFYNNLLMLCAESYIKVIDLLSFDLD